MTQRVLNFAPPITEAVSWDKLTYREVLLKCTSEDGNKTESDYENKDEKKNEFNSHPKCDNTFQDEDTHYTLLNNNLLKEGRTENCKLEENLEQIEKYEFQEKGGEHSTDTKGFTFEEFVSKFKELDTGIDKNNNQEKRGSIAKLQNAKRYTEFGRPFWRPRSFRGGRSTRYSRPYLGLNQYGIRYQGHYGGRRPSYNIHRLNYNRGSQSRGSSPAQPFKRHSRTPERRVHLISVSSQTDHNDDTINKDDIDEESIPFKWVESDKKIEGQKRRESDVSDLSEKLLTSESYAETSDLESDIEIIIDSSAFRYDQRNSTIN